MNRQGQKGVKAIILYPINALHMHIGNIKAISLLSRMQRNYHFLSVSEILST